MDGNSPKGMICTLMKKGVPVACGMDLLYYGDLRAPLLEEIKEELDPLEDISALIKEAIAEDAPLA